MIVYDSHATQYLAIKRPPNGISSNLIKLITAPVTQQLWGPQH